MKRSSITMTAILALLLSCTGCKSTVPKTPSTEAPASISENGLAISITSQPEAHYNLPGSTATFSVKAASETSLSYSWSYRRKADEPWEACDQSDMTTDTLSVSVTTDLDGSEYRCTITNEDGETVYSEPARLLLTIPLNSNYFPDDGFLVYLRQYDKNENSLLEYEERASVETIDLSYGVWNKANGETLWVRDLKGIEFLPKLSLLNCSGNELTTLDVTGCGALRSLWVDENVTVVGLNGNIQSTRTAPRTPAKLQITLQPSSETVSLGMKTSFRTYALGEGNLTYQWQYRKNDHTSTWTDFDQAVLSNELTIEAKKEMAGYQVRCAVSDSAGATVYSESATLSILIPITPENFPDEAFRQYIADEFDLDKDGNLSEYEIKEINEIHLEGGYALNGVKTPVIDLTGIEFFPNLEWLDCEENQLSSLDVSQNPLLWHLHCASNHLTALNVSQNPELYYLDCYDNQLSSLIISGAQKLSSLICSANMLTELDTSSNPELMDLYCHHNSIQKLDLSNCPNMMELSINADVPVTGIQEKVVVKRIRTEVISPTAEGLTPLEDGWYVSDNIDKEDSKDRERYGDAWFSKGKVEDGVLFLEGYLVPYQGGGITKLKVASDVEVYACGGTAEDDEADIEYFNDCFWSDEPGLYIQVYVENGVVTRIDICS